MSAQRGHQSKSSPGCSAAIICIVILTGLACGLWYYVGQSGQSTGEEVWTVNGPASRSEGLFADEFLTDPECLDCLIGELPGGTKLKPAWQGCKTSQPYSISYCHVQVLSGTYKGEYGWVNENVVDK